MFMKTAFLLCALFLAVCAIAQKPKSASGVPKELIGHWQLGTFSMTNFWNPTTGQYAGNAGEASTSYQISADGTMEEFFIYNSTSYNCRTQILGYRKGRIEFNADGSFRFCPASGYYRTANCFKKEWTKTEYTSKDLCPQYQMNCSWSIENGNLILKEKAGENVTTYKKISAIGRE